MESVESDWKSWNGRLCYLAEFIVTRLANHTQGQGDGGQSSDKSKGQSRCFPLVVVEPAGQQ